MRPLKLDDGLTLRDIEQSLQHISDNTGTPLQLKKGFVNKRRGALHDAARLQMLATWARLSPKNHLHFHSNNKNKKNELLNDLCDYAPGITALRLCEGVLIDEEIIPRKNALTSASDKMTYSDQLEWDRVIKGRTIDLTCVSGAKVQYLRPLFNTRNSRSVKSASEMFEILNNISDRIMDFQSERIPDKLIYACANFFSELMKNTQEHAVKNHLNQPYIEHAEGVIFSWEKMLETQRKQDFSGNARLLDFWNREQTSTSAQGGQESLRCLQISFFDTGPGFASRATGKPTTELSLQDEKNALLNCLKKNVSTKHETGAGNGLPSVLEALRLIGGLISIRTGRFNIFNAFSPGEERDIFAFDDWFGEPETNPLAPATGAVISLLVPIRGRQDA